ncbi:J domain-containing protein [Rheinheimera sediminis]|uniref:cold adaptation protein ActJcold adaptation protein ActJ n=1 Tax=Rheinheimera sp. YQF-1 TaxID=2499626 RepID=UPI000FDBB127|nr:DnaJ domain-containing protein [Rheinheimera sp. YQF-1]RVT47125.1 J domain-containing protein [Rheinheimera sp. YQF-1]
MINYFRILGVKSSANEDEIKKAYKRLSNKYHPDKLLNLTEDEKEQAGVQLQRVKEAYDVLSDAKKRAAFIKDFNNVIVPDPTAAMKELWDSYYPSVKG